MSYPGMLQFDPHSLGMADEGEKVRFLAKNGLVAELEAAKALWKEDEELTVTAVDIGGFSSTYQFAGYGGFYNTVMFEPVIQRPSIYDKAGDN